MKEKVFAQVYSMIRTFPEGLVDALHYFSEVGYDGVELVGNNTDGLSIEEFVKLLQELNLKVYSIHSVNEKDDIVLAKALGVQYLAASFSPDPITREDIIKECEALNKKGEALAKEGIKVCIHNHADEFRFVKGEEGQTRIYDLLLEHTDPRYVGFELDVGWAARAGVDSIRYIKNNPGRFPLIHVKECCQAGQCPEDMEHFPKRIFNDGRLKKTEDGVPILTEEMEHELYESRNWNRGLGTGIIDWKALTEAGDAQGCIAYINEREYYHYNGSDGTNRSCVKLDYDYLRSL
ncbi:MAG: sugar phosphate isomerase/epimerase [Blautia sp.]|nr:sugar phosphate isomerase/epimerase [Blautia sp.]